MTEVILKSTNMQPALLEAGCQAVGISRGGNTSKIHLATDACGNPVRLMLSAGNVNDITVAPQLVDSLDLSQCDTLIADKGYDSDVFRRQVSGCQTRANIPYKKDREDKNVSMDWYLHGLRHLVENAFARLKHYRAVATRYDKLARHFYNTVLWVCILIWLPI